MRLKKVPTFGLLRKKGRSPHRERNKRVDKALKGGEVQNAMARGQAKKARRKKQCASFQKKKGTRVEEKTLRPVRKGEKRHRGRGGLRNTQKKKSIFMIFSKRVRKKWKLELLQKEKGG